MRSTAMLAGLFPLLVAARAEAATVTVTNPTELRAAIAAAVPGTEIVLAAGTYAISGANLSCSANGTPAMPIVVRAATPLAAKLELSTLEGFLVSGASWRFEDLDVKGTCANDDDCEHAFHVVGGATGFVLRRNRIVDFNAQLKVNATLGAPPTIPHDGLVEGNELYDSRPRNTAKPVTKLNIDTGDRWIVSANYIHDFHHADGSPSYGAFMKSGGKGGIFGRNLVLCTKDGPTSGTDIGLSFGGGGTGAEFCAPAFNAGVPCAVEHEDGTMRNNVIARCSDVGIYVNRGKNTKLLFNTLIATSGIDFRFATTTGESRGNVLGGVIRNREGGTHTASVDLENVAQATFEAMYIGALVGDLRQKGDLSALLGKGPASPDVTTDYCARSRSGTWDLGALQHSLGNCVTFPPPLAGPGSPPDGSMTSSGASSSGDPGPSGSSDGGAGGASSGASASSGAVGAAPAEDSGCACRFGPGGAGSSAAGLVVALGLAFLRRARRRVNGSSLRPLPPPS